MVRIIRRRAAALSATVLLALAACSILQTHLKSPRLSLLDVQLLKSDLLTQRFRVRMRVANPNDRALSVAGIAYHLQLEGEDFGDGASAASFVVPARGESEFDMTLNTNMATVFFKLLARKDRSLSDPLNYRIVGKVSLSHGLLRSVPFDQTGQFRLK